MHAHSNCRTMPEKIKHQTLLITALVLAAMLPTASLRATGGSATNQTEKLAPGQMPYFDAVPDPLEGFNRCSWAFNEWLFRGVIYPLSLGYNTVAPKPVRNRITDAGHNLTLSGTAGEQLPAREMARRVGGDGAFRRQFHGRVGRPFDPATHWKIGRVGRGFWPDAGPLGLRPGVLSGDSRSSGRAMAAMPLGKLVDWPLDICFWIGVAYDDEIWPDGAPARLWVQRLQRPGAGLKRQLDSLVDPYQALRTLYSLNRQRLIRTTFPAWRRFQSRPHGPRGAVQAPDREFRGQGGHAQSPDAGNRKKTVLFLLDAEEAGAAGVLYSRPGLVSAGPFHAGVCGHDVSARLFRCGLFQSVSEGVHGARLQRWRCRAMARRTAMTW